MIPPNACKPRRHISRNKGLSPEILNPGVGLLTTSLSDSSVTLGADPRSMY